MTTESKQTLEKNGDVTERSKASEEHVARKSWNMEALKRAKQEAEKGEFISHEAIGAWVNSLGTDEELPVPKVDVFKNPI